MKKVLLYNYSLSVWLAGRKKELYKEGTLFLFSSELLCITLSGMMVLLSLIEFKFSGWVLLVLFLITSLIAFYGLKSWILNQLAVKNTEQNYKLISKLWFYRLAGLFLYFGSVYFFLIVGILVFEGYLIDP